MTVYANLVDGEVKGVYDLIPKFWNGISHFDIQCAKDETFMNQNGFVKIIRDNRPFDAATHRMSDMPSYSVVGNQVHEYREIVEIPPPAVPTEEQLLMSIRSRRDQLMQDFEWRYVRHARQTRLGINPTDNIADLDQYMQSLADITNQSDLNNIDWPVYTG